MPSKNEKYFKLFSVLMGVVAGLIVCEGFLRITGPQWLKTRMEEVAVKNSTGVNMEECGSDSGWPIEKKDGKFVKFTPGSSFDVCHYEYKNVAHIDNWGGRVIEAPSKVKNPGPVVFLGDSFTFGVGVNDVESYPNLLGQRLGYRFVNLGSPGSCIYNQLDVAEARHQELGNPKLYVFNVFIGNDLTNLIEIKTSLQDNKETFLKPQASNPLTHILQGINDSVRNSSFFRKIYLIQFIKSKALGLYNQYLASKGDVRRMDDEIFHVITVDNHLDEMMEHFDEELERLKKLSLQNNFKVLFILIPDRHQVNGQLLKDKMKYYNLASSDVDVSLPNNRLKRDIQKYGFDEIDPTDCLRGKFKNNPHLYYVLDNHLTSQGHEALANCLEKQLGEKILSLLR